MHKNVYERNDVVYTISHGDIWVRTRRWWCPFAWLFDIVYQHGACDRIIPVTERMYYCPTFSYFKSSSKYNYRCQVDFWMYIHVCWLITASIWNQHTWNRVIWLTRYFNYSAFIMWRSQSIHTIKLYIWNSLIYILQGHAPSERNW